MKNLFLVTVSLLGVGAQAQISVYDCNAMNPVVTQAEVVAAGYNFHQSCIEFSGQTYDFPPNTEKKITALSSITIKEDFHAGPSEDGAGLWLKIEEKALYDIAVMNYPDLNAIQKFKKVEFGIDLEGEIEERIKEFVEPGSFPGLDPLNPYIADDMNSATSELVIHATFIHSATGTVKERDFFYYHEYEHAGNDWDDAINDNNDFLMRVRFAPPLPGEWETHVTVTLDGTTTLLPTFAFLVQDNLHPGYVKVHYNKRNLQRGADIVFPVGHVFPGPYNRAPGGALTGWTPWGDPPGLDPSKNTTVADWNQYLGDIESYIGQGGKSFKMVQTSYGNLLEFEELGNYTKRMHYGWEQDKILDMCEEHDVLVNFNLLFQDVIMGYGQNGNGTSGDPWDYGKYGPDGPNVVFNPDWYEPFCYFVPGTLPSHQFLDPVFMNYHKQRTRYYVARYGYSPQIYTWELMSEPFHMDQFTHGEITATNGALINDEPASIYYHPGHQDAINAINTYHNQLSEYMKNDLKDTDHLITLDQALVNKNDLIYPYQCAYSPYIEIIGYNYYSERPDKLIEHKEDDNGKNNLNVEYHQNESKNEISAYKMFYEKFFQIQKPIILSEAGHSHWTMGVDCYGKSGNIIDVMTLGFTGVAAVHPWEGYKYGDYNNFDERLLWPATISAEEHMNSEKVIPTLHHWNGYWKQGRQIEKVYTFDDEYAKELQYYLAQSNETATGYVRNRSYNAYTQRSSDDCSPHIGLIPYSDGFQPPHDNFFFNFLQ